MREIYRQKLIKISRKSERDKERKRERNLER